MSDEWILVTGPAHSGTRLLVDVLGRHPEITLPDDEVLTVAQEYPWLHNIFLTAMREMRLYEEEIPVDPEELAFVLDAYAQAGGEGRYTLVKLPHSPLLARSAFEEAVDLQAVVYTTRDSDKIRRSKEKRGKDIRLIENRERFLDQVKRCRLEERPHLLNAWDFEETHAAKMRTFDTLIDEWAEEPGPPTTTELTAEAFVGEKDRLRSFLDSLDLSTDEVEEMTEIVDPERLQQEGWMYQLKEKAWRGKNWLRAQLERRT